MSPASRAASCSSTAAKSVMCAPESTERPMTSASSWIATSPPASMSSTPSAGHSPRAERATRRRKNGPSRSVIQPRPFQPSPSARGEARSILTASSTKGRRTTGMSCGGVRSWCQAAPRHVPAITSMTPARSARDRPTQAMAPAMIPNASQGPGSTPRAASSEQPRRRGRASQSAGQCPKRSGVRESCSRESGLAMDGGHGRRWAGTGPPRRANPRRGAWRGPGPEADSLGVR